MEKIRLVETFEDTPSISLTEDSNDTPKSSRVDGKYIIGMIEGQFFKPDGMSRNGRWYPRSLWTKALNRAETKNRLASSTMFGEIGHSEGPVEDMTLRQGCASHFIDDLWIDDKGRGMGRAYILGTPTGQLLKIYLGAGCKLKVSTRGEGSYKEDETHDGCPVVDDESYDFQTVDFVLNPGFLETSAILKESYNTLDKKLEVEKKNIQETIAHVKKEGEKRMEFNIDAYVADLKEELKAVKAENKSLNEQLQAKNNELLQSQMKNNAEVGKLNEELKPYKNLKVSAKSITENFKKLQGDLKKATADKVQISEELKDLKSLCGSKEELQAAINLSTKSLKLIEEYRKIGTPKQCRQDVQEARLAVMRSTNKIKALTETAKKTEKLVEKYQALEANYSEASKRFNETLSKTAKLIERYKAQSAENTRLVKKVATMEEAIARATKVITELKQCATLSEQLVKKVQNDKQKVQESTKVDVKADAIKLSEQFGCTIETAAKLVKKNGIEKAQKMLESVKQTESKRVNFSDSKALLEEVAQLDRVTNIPAEKSAKDFMSDGMIKNYFNQQALGKEVVYDDLSKLDGTKNAGEDKAKDLLKKYGMKYEVEEAPKGLDKELTPAQAEAEAKKLLK